MTLQQLKYIVEIDRWGHFGKAAEACGLTQSTLSLMVKKLEEELDVKIFDRDKHPLAATEIGRKVIDRAKVVLYNADQIGEMTRSEKETLSGQLRIAMISTVAPLLVPALFNHITANYPEIELETEEMLTETIKDKLHKAEIDIGVITSPAGDDQLLEIPLYTEKFVAYVSKEDPAYRMDSIPFGYITQRPVWIMKNGLRRFDFSTVKAEELGRYENYFEGGRVGMLLQMVNDNGGITIIPETHVHLMLYSWQEGVRPITDPQKQRTISFVIRRDYIHEAKLNAAIKAVKQAIPPSLAEGIIKRDYIKL
ncbi:MAG: LysR family transcriptional regulator [Bacteroidales bacterium]|nr:LysR family transcriptional regulator [Bacteroidales bacterium]